MLDVLGDTEVIIWQLNTTDLAIKTQVNVI
jgi:hypothetical protein